MQNAERVLYFFKEISCIPRASYDERRISNYLIAFAKARDLKANQDKYGNVIIRKPATIPDCECPPVIIQGHMDMVYVKAPGCERKYTDGISILEKDGWLCADGTTLGADNGIAVAYALAILDSSEIPHPDLEMVFTVQEEVGLKGAAKFNGDKLQGRYFLNLDTEEEGVFFTSCAGAVRNELTLPVKRKEVKEMRKLRVRLTGLSGGHSGMEIGYGRGNAIMLMARLLSGVCGKNVRLFSFECDGKMNAIASEAEAVLYVRPKKMKRVINTLESTVEDFNRELKGIDKVILKTKTGKKKKAKKAKKKKANCYTKRSQSRILSAIQLIPNGVIGMSNSVPGLVETSANPGVVTQFGDRIVIASSVRSSVSTRKWETAQRFSAIADLVGGKSKCSGDYPQWEYRPVSPLRDLAMETYKELFDREAEARAIHAGLECGYFDKKLEDVDIISFGPNVKDAHSPNEKANIESIENVWKLIQSILEKLGNK